MQLIFLRVDGNFKKKKQGLNENFIEIVYNNLDMKYKFKQTVPIKLRYPLPFNSKLFLEPHRRLMIFSIAGKQSVKDISESTRRKICFTRDTLFQDNILESDLK